MRIPQAVFRPARWTRVFVATGVLWLVVWHLLVLLDYPRSVVVFAGIYGFVLHVVFGKAYALIPSYFESELAVSWAPFVQFVGIVPGTILLTLAAMVDGFELIALFGSALWVCGVGIFVVAIGRTVAGPLLRGQTGTSDANAERASLDRFANRFIPIVLIYLLAGTFLLAWETMRSGLSGGPSVSHLLAVGTGVLLIFAVGFRLFPRFLVVSPHPLAARIILPAGAIGPAFIAYDFLGSGIFQFGAALTTVGVVGFALAYVDMYRRSSRRRIGFHVVLLAVGFGVFAISLALYAAFVDLRSPVVAAHVRTAMLGFLGLTIIGVTYQFYPPNIGELPGISDRTATFAAGIIAGGLLIEVVGLLGLHPLSVRIGQLSTLMGILIYAYIVLGLFVERW